MQLYPRTPFGRMLKARSKMMLLIFAVIKIFSSIMGAYGKDWHVGQQQQQLGDLTLNQNISTIQELLRDGDKVIVHGPEIVYDCMVTPIKVSIFLLGLQTATLSANCGNMTKDPKYVLTENIILNIAGRSSVVDSNDYNFKVVMQDLTFSLGEILATNVDLVIENCIFGNSSLRMHAQHETHSYDFRPYRVDDPYYLETLISDIETCRHANITMKNTSWSQTQLSSAASVTEISQLEYDIFIKCSISRVSLLDSFFGNRRIQVFANTSLQVFVDGVTFEGHPEKETKVGGLSLLFPIEDANRELSLQNSVFKNLTPSNIFYGRLLSKNIRSGAIVMAPFTTNHEATGLSVLKPVEIKNCSFVGNQRAIVLGKFPDTLVFNITDCNFTENKVVIDGGAIYTSAGSLVISDSQFTGNLGGSFYHYKRLVGNVSFTYASYASRIYGYAVKDESLFHYATPEGQQSGPNVIKYGYAGGGGAIYIDLGDTNISNCVFRENAAVDSGGAVRVSNKGRAFVRHSIFKNPSNINNTLEGYHIFSIGKMLEIENVTFVNNILPDNNIDASALFVFGEREGCRISTLTMTCPPGFNLFIFNTSSKSNGHAIHKKFSVFDTIYYSCEICVDRYNLGGGKMNLSYSDTGGNLAVDHDEGKCLPCPYGGNCSLQLAAKPNYWGITDNTAARFFACPKRYCCNDLNCPSFNVCSFNRTGRLCGSCLPGYTQALFSTHCITMDQCNDSWIMILAGMLGMAYTAFLMFQKDITNFLVSSPVTLRELTEVCCLSCFSKSTKPRRESASATISSSSISHLHVNEDSSVSAMTMRDHKDVQKTASIGLSLQPTQIPISNGTHEVREPSPLSPASSTASSTSNTNNNNSSNNNNNSRSNINNNSSSNNNNNNGGGLLVLLFYYFQDAALIKISTIYVSPNEIIDNLELIVSEIFRFRFNFFSLIASDVCILPVMDIVGRDLLLAVFAPLLIVIALVLYLFCKLVFRCSQIEVWNSIALRAVSALMLGLLFSFQKLATTSFSFLHCVYIGDTRVLFIDGSIACYETWQWITLVYVMSCIVPFSVHLAIAPPLLERCWITFPEFVAASVFPFPFILSWPFRFRPGIAKPRASHERRSQEADTICAIVQGPYRSFDLPGVLKSVCWSGNIMFRRTLLMIARTFIVSPLVSMALVFTVCALSIIQHVYVWPYRDRRFNMAGTVTALALLIVSSINLLKAAFEVAEYIPQGPVLSFMEKLDTAESVVLVWLPLAGLLLLVIALLFRLSFRLLMVIFRCIRRCKCNN